MENFGGTKGIQLRPMKSHHFKLSCGMLEKVSQRVDCENELARRKERKTNEALQVSQNVAWRKEIKEGEKEKEQWQSFFPPKETANRVQK